jgi:hypothetical protein
MAVTLEIESDDPEAVFSAIFGSGTPILGQVARYSEGMALVNMSPTRGLSPADLVTLLADNGANITVGVLSALLYDVFKGSARAIVLGARRILLEGRDADVVTDEIGDALEEIGLGERSHGSP